MESKKSKTLILNTLLLIFCVGVIALFCFMPSNKVDVLKEYNIIFDSNGGNAIAAITIEEGGTIQPPEAPTREGYIFVGWMLGDEFYDFAATVTGDVTLKAMWEEKLPDVVYYTVSFNVDGGTPITPITVAENQMATAPIAPTKEGFTFVEWQLAGVAYDFNSPVTQDITLTAIWMENVVETEPEPEDPNAPKTYKVKFSLNGGTGGNAKTLTVEEGKTATKPSKNPTRSGYTFAGWYLNGKAYNFSTPVNKDITLVAQWTEIPKKKYVVKFYDNYGKFCDLVNVTEGSTAKVPSLCTAGTKVGYSSIGWATSLNATKSTFTPGSTKVTSNLDLYPVYSKKTFNVSGTEITDGTTKAGYTLNVANQGETIEKIVIKYNRNGQSKEFTALWNGSSWYVNIAMVWENATSITITLKNSNESFVGNIKK